MPIRLNEEFKKSLLSKLAIEMFDKDPFIEENNKTYIRYDKIVIHLEEKYETIVEFYWKGESVCILNLVGNISPTGSITIEGLEGRTEITLI